MPGRNTTVFLLVVTAFLMSFTGPSMATVDGDREAVPRTVQMLDHGVNMISEADESSAGPAGFMIVDPDGNTILVDQHV